MKKAFKSKNKISFSPKDIGQIKRSGLNSDDVDKQLALYRQGPNYLKLNRPCTVNDGILSITAAQRKKLISFYEKESARYKLMKFVPASGAASRMFAEWFSVMEAGGFGTAKLNQSFLRNLQRFPFFSLVAKNKRAAQFIEQKNIRGLLEYILKDKGLNFGWLPKALIPFHLYPAGQARTALEEHLFEGAQYVRGRGDICHLHFTISPEHKKNVAARINAVKSRHENLGRIKFKISSSVQSPATNMLAVDENNLPLRDSAGVLILRPGGHGSLLSNLQNLDADFIFVKNIDNIAPEKRLLKILPYKKMLGGLALKIQREIFSLLRQMENDKIDSAQMEKIKNYCLRINIALPRGMAKQSQKMQKQIIFSLLNRPLRVCAIVRNEGEPGGAPFWVEEREGKQTLQIVESGHVDKSSPRQIAVWSAAKYFNPVDMVCCTKNYRGEKFNLDSYVNHDAYLISRKNEKGLSLKALESPGLWNGGMAYWNTIFVELPIIVFNPVKTVYDLLRPEHKTF
jgi:hypothetical protein